MSLPIGFSARDCGGSAAGDAAGMASDCVGSAAGDAAGRASDSAQALTTRSRCLGRREVIMVTSFVGTALNLPADARCCADERQGLLGMVLAIPRATPRCTQSRPPLRIPCAFGRYR